MDHPSVYVGRRKVMPRVCIVDGKRHSRKFPRRDSGRTGLHHLCVHAGRRTRPCSRGLSRCDALISALFEQQIERCNALEGRRCRSPGWYCWSWGCSGLCSAVACKRRSHRRRMPILPHGTGSCWPIHLMRGQTFQSPIAGMSSTIRAERRRARSWSIPTRVISIMSCRETRRSATASRWGRKRWPGPVSPGLAA